MTGASLLDETRRIVLADGCTLHVRRVGRAGAPTLLCVPGMTRNSRDFDNFAALMASDHQLLLPDIRGRGLSAPSDDPMRYQPHVYARDLLAVLDAFLIERAFVLGTSMGGFVAMLMAERAPQRVCGVILNDVGPDDTGSDPAKIAAFLSARKTFSDWEAAAQSYRAGMAASFPHFTAEDWAHVARRQCTEAPDGSIMPQYDPRIALPLTSPQAVRHDRWAVFRAIAARPILVLRAEHSTILTRETLARMHAESPRLEGIELGGIGHAPYLDEAGAADRISRFVSAHG